MSRPRTNKPRAQRVRVQAGDKRAAETRERILGAALALFRERGFDETTMRDIARSAGMSLGAAYYYFPSKEAIVHAYYRTVSDRWQHGARELLASTLDLHERVRRLYHLHFDVVGRDRPLLAALVRVVADPGSELAVFAQQTTELRRDSLSVWREAVSLPEIPDRLRELGALALWLLNLALMLYFVWDDSPRQKQTRRLIDEVVGALVPLVPLLSLPFAEPLVAQLESVLSHAGLRANSLDETV
jgi:AcrR family transcriptional regulator